MAKFTSPIPLGMEYEGHNFTGPAGTEFRLPDSLRAAFDAEFGTRVHPTWIVEDEMAEGGGEHPNLAAHIAIGLISTASTTAHVAENDPHVQYALDADLANHEDGPHGVPAGVIVMWGGAISAIPAGWLLCNGSNGTPDLRSRFIKGAVAGSDPGATGGAATHTHAGHSAHAVTQPGAHSDHTFTQPSAHSDHAALAHSAHAGATVGNHTDVLNHVHVEQLQGGTTGTTTGTHLMGSAATGGSLRSAGQSTLNPTSGGVAAQVHTVGQANAHSDHAAQAHSAHAGGGVNAHSAHSGTAVDAHSAHDSPNSEPAYYALAFIQKS